MFPEITAANTVIGKGVHIAKCAVIKNRDPAFVPLLVDDLLEWRFFLSPEAPGFIVGWSKCGIDNENFSGITTLNKVPGQAQPG